MVAVTAGGPASAPAVTSAASGLPRGVGYPGGGFVLARRLFPRRNVCTAAGAPLSQAHELKHFPGNAAQKYEPGTHVEPGRLRRDERRAPDEETGDDEGYEGPGRGGGSVIVRQLRSLSCVSLCCGAVLRTPLGLSRPR